MEEENNNNSNIQQEEEELQQQNNDNKLIQPNLLMTPLLQVQPMTPLTPFLQLETPGMGSLMTPLLNGLNGGENTPLLLPQQQQPTDQQNVTISNIQMGGNDSQKADDFSENKNNNQDVKEENKLEEETQNNNNNNQNNDNDQNNGKVEEEKPQEIKKESSQNGQKNIEKNSNNTENNNNNSKQSKQSPEKLEKQSSSTTTNNNNKNSNSNNPSQFSQNQQKNSNNNTSTNATTTTTTNNNNSTTNGAASNSNNLKQQQLLIQNSSLISPAAQQAAQKLDLEVLMNPPQKEYVAKHLDNYLLMGKLFVTQKNFTQALKIYEIIVEHCPHQGNSWVLCGRTAFMQKEYMKAMLAYQQALQKNTMAQNDAKVWFDYAICLFKLENYSTAETAFNRVLSLEPNFQPFKGTIIVYLAIIKKLNYNYRACLDLLIKALKEEGFTIQQTVAVLCNIGYCLEMLKEPEEALGIYKKAFELNNNSFLALKCYAWHYFQNKQYRETLEIIWKMEEISFEQSFDCLFMTAKCFEAQGSYKEAMNYFNKSVKLNPQHATALCCLGMSFYKFNMYKDAFQCFQRAYQNDPSLLDSLFNIALLYELSKNYSEAINIYIKLLQINPDDTIVIKRKIAIEQGLFDQISNDYPLREPDFRIKVQLWLENQHSTYIPNPPPQITSNLQKRHQMYKEKKTSEQFGMFAMNSCDNYDDDNGSNFQYQKQKTHPFIATTPLLHPQLNTSSLLQQSPMPKWNFPHLDEEQCHSPLPPQLLEKKEDNHNNNDQQMPLGMGFDTYNYLSTSPGLYPRDPNSPYKPIPYNMRKESVGGFAQRNPYRKASAFMMTHPQTPNMFASKGTPNLGPLMTPGMQPLDLNQQQQQQMLSQPGFTLNASNQQQRKLSDMNNLELNGQILQQQQMQLIQSQQQQQSQQNNSSSNNNNHN